MKISNELIKQTIEQDGLALEHVPGNKKSKGLCLSAVKSNALALEYVPERFKTLEMCNAAICSDWRAFFYFPESMYTLEMCLEILKLILSSFDMEIHSEDEKSSKVYLEKKKKTILLPKVL